MPPPRTPPIATSMNVAQMLQDVFSAVYQLNCMSEKAIYMFRKLSQAGKLVCPGHRPSDPRPTNPALSAHVLVLNVKAGFYSFVDASGWSRLRSDAHVVRSSLSLLLQ